MSYLSELNPVQRQAVEHINGPSLIIAGAGSGKTRVLTYKIAHLINNGVDPFNILALTFTNKAAKEMKSRIASVVGDEARNVWMGTFHSIFARILRAEASKLGYPSNFTIYDMDDSKSLIRGLLKEFNLNDKLYKPNIVQYRISSAKNNLISPAEYLASPELMSEDESSGRLKLGMLYSLYAKRCFMSGAMDFDDLLFKMYELLNKFPETLHKYQHFFKYILVDEFQDTNYAQYAILKKLADVFQNISVVGDDAQSIYSFRGAVIDNILNYEKQYPDLQVFKLEQNYRSTQTIVNAANEVIARNKGQLDKKLWTDNDLGNRIKLIRTQSDNDEGRIVADAIAEEMLRKHYKNDDFAILYRTNAQSRSFEEALRKRNIPYRIYGGMSFYQRKEIKDFIAYLRLVVNHNDSEALKRIINYPARGIGKTTLEKAIVISGEQGLPLWEIFSNIHQYNIGSRAAQLIGDFVTMIKSFATMLTTHNAYDLAFHVAKSSKLLTELHLDKTIEGLSRYENFQELLNGIKEFTENDEFIDEETQNQLDNNKNLAAYLQDISLLTDADNDKDDTNKVKLMTVHASKGLEFPSVYLVGLEENLFPSMLSVGSRADLEEERRLFYVALTRAEQSLTLSYANTRYKFGNLNFCEPSRFLNEIPSIYIEQKGAHAAGNQPLKPFPNDPPSKFKPLTSGVQQKSSNSGTYKPSPNFTPDSPSKIETGMEVEHQRFGYGKVINLEGRPDNKIATINFKDAGEKKIMLQYAKLQIKSQSKV